MHYIIEPQLNISTNPNETEHVSCSPKDATVYAVLEVMNPEAEAKYLGDVMPAQAQQLIAIARNDRIEQRMNDINRQLITALICNANLLQRIAQGEQPADAIKQQQCHNLAVLKLAGSHVPKDAPNMQCRRVFQIAELPTEKAKEKARSWAREFVCDHDWYSNTYDDAKTIGLEITSFELDRNRHAKGKFLTDTIDCAELIIKNHGKDCETYETAQAFISYRASMIADLESGELEDDDKYDNLCDEFLKSLLDDYSLLLQHDYEHMQSDEYIDDFITVNEYEFTEDGNRA